MPPKKDDKGGKSKEGGEGGKKGGKAKKKKWSKTKTREKLQNLVVFDKATYDKLLKDIPASKLITPSVVSERLRVNGSLARRAIRELEAKGLATRVVKHRRQLIYTRSSAAAERAQKQEAEAAAAATTKKGGKKPAQKEADE